MVFFLYIQYNEINRLPYRGISMKETKPLYLALFLILLFTLIFNIMLPFTLNYIPDMLFKNRFFMLDFSRTRNGIILDTNSCPNFLNWIMLLSFIGIFISLLIRKHINKSLRPYKISESK